MGAEIAGRLKQRVRIERRDALADGAGGTFDRWELVGEYWAEMRPLETGGMSSVTGDTRVTQRRWRIFLRTGAEVALGMRLRWRGLDLRVMGVEADPFAPEQLLVIAEELGRRSAFSE
jgi:head-tail adaptor